MSLDSLPLCGTNIHPVCLKTATVGVQFSCLFPVQGNSGHGSQTASQYFIIVFRRKSYQECQPKKFGAGCMHSNWSKKNQSANSDRIATLYGNCVLTVVNTALKRFMMPSFSNPCQQAEVLGGRKENIDKSIEYVCLQPFLNVLSFCVESDRVVATFNSA